MVGVSVRAGTATRFVVLRIPEAHKYSLQGEWSQDQLFLLWSSIIVGFCAVPAVILYATEFMSDQIDSGPTIAWLNRAMDAKAQGLVDRRDWLIHTLHEAVLHPAFFIPCSPTGFVLNLVQTTSSNGRNPWSFTLIGINRRLLQTNARVLRGH